MKRMETFVAKLGGKPVKKIVNGKTYLVASMTILTEGVLHGTEGPIFYPKETNTRYASVWNGVPLVLRHPMKDGKPLLATTPYVWTNSEVGRFFESKGFEDGRVAGEAWFPEEDLKRVDNSVYEHVSQGKVMDVSVGAKILWDTHLPKVYNGKPYARTAKYYSPDHIALLPDEKGACSSSDGCGLFVANAFVTEDGNYKVGEDGEYVLNPAWVQDDAIWQKAKEAVRKKKKKKYKGKTFWKVVASVYKKMGGKVGGMAHDSQVVHNKEVSEVNQTANGSNNVEKDELVGWLVLNCDCWKGQGDKELLTAMPVEKLKQLKSGVEKSKETAVLVANARKEFGIADNVSFIDGIKEKTKPTKVEKTEEKVVHNTATTTEVKRLTPEEEEDLNFARTEKNRQKAVLVERLILNVSGDEQRRSVGNKFMQKSLGELQELVSLLPLQPQGHGNVNNSQFDFAKPIASIPGYGGNYALAGGGYVANNEPQPETLHDAMPSWDWSEETAK